MKRFSATIKEISNEMESRNIDDLANLIKDKNDSAKYKSKNKKSIIKVPALEPKAEINNEESKILHSEDKVIEVSDLEKLLAVDTLDLSPITNPHKAAEGDDSMLTALNAVEIAPQIEQDSKTSSLLDKIIVSDTNMAFNFFPYGSIKELINAECTNDERHKMLDVMLTLMKSISNIDDKFKTSASFANFMIETMDIVDDESIVKILSILKYTLDTNCIVSYANLQHIFRESIKHLGSKAGEVRQEAMRMMISIMKGLDSKEFMQLSLEFLTSNNWRIREEMLNLIIINILNKIDPEFDYYSFIPLLSKLSNDEHPKVRFVAKEALAILATKGNKELVMKLCGQYIVHNEYVKIQEKVITENSVTFNEK